MPDPDTTAWVNAVIANGGSVSAGRQTLVDNLIVGLKADSIWAKLEQLWLFAAENTQSALTGLTSGNLLATVNNAPAFTVDTGYTGADAASGAPYITTGYQPFLASTLYTATDAHYSIWSMTNIASSNGGLIIGISGAGGESSFYLTYIDGNVYARINDNPAAGSQTLTGTRIGHWVVNRTGVNADELFQNGSSYVVINQSGGTVAAGAFFILADAGGGGALGNPNTVSVASMGASLTPTNISNFYSRLSTYLSFPTAAGASLVFRAQTLAIPLLTTGNIKVTFPIQ